MRMTLHAKPQDQEEFVHYFSARAAVLLTFLALLYDYFSIPFYSCLFEQKNLELSCSTTVGSYSVLAGQGKSGSPVSKDTGLLCLPWLTYACTVQEHTYLHMGSKLHSRLYSGAWTGRSRHRRISAVLQDISERGIKTLADFSSNLERWKHCCGEQPAAKVCRAKHHRSAHLSKTDGKADECLKLWGSGPAKNKLFPCKKVPGEVVKSCSVILNQKSQCLLILAQLQQNHHNSFLCGLRWKK